MEQTPLQAYPTRTESVTDTSSAQPPPKDASKALASARRLVTGKNQATLPGLQKELIEKLVGNRSTVLNVDWIKNRFDDISRFFDVARQFIGSVHAVRLVALLNHSTWRCGPICETDVREKRQLRRLIRDRLCCVYCFQAVLDNEEGYHGWTDDHLIPASLGGPDDDWNLVTCCHLCNSLRGNWVPADSASWDSRKAFITAVRHYIKKRRTAEAAEFLRVKSDKEITNERDGQRQALFAHHEQNNDQGTNLMLQQRADIVG